MIFSTNRDRFHISLRMPTQPGIMQT